MAMLLLIAAAALSPIGGDGSSLPVQPTLVQPSAAQPALPSQAPPETALPFIHSAVGKTLADNAPQRLSDDLLSDERGGSSLLLSNQTLGSVVSGNTLGDYTAGNVAFSDQAFSNFAGVGNITINTGAQSSLQSAMNITINVGN